MKNETTSLIAPKTEHEETGTQSAAAASRQPPCVWPGNSVIEDYVLLARQYSESEDQLLVGAFLPVVAGALGRNVYITFGQRMFPNLYHVIAVRPGMRSAVIDFVTHIARDLLPKEALFSGVTSVQSLFAEYLACPDKLWLIGEDVLNNWTYDVAGKGVARQVLTLYGCVSWRESYLRHKKGDGEAIREVETSTSILIGASPVDARFNALEETRDGMRQRFSYYTSERLGRLIVWPLAYDNSRELSKLVTKLEALKALKGEMRLSPEAFELWKRLQAENRRQIEDSVNEIHGGLLSFSPMKILKLAMLFEICRWVKDNGRDWRLIQADSLAQAAQHEAYCVEANRRLDGSIIPFAPALSPSGEANIDAINCQLDRIRQERHRHCEPDPGYCGAGFA